MTDTRISIRPIIKNIGTSKKKTDEENFQNTTLRPILKLQHELLIAFFENYVRRKKIDFQELNSVKKNDLLSNMFRNDNMFKTELRGMIIGQFTVNEFVLYQSISSDVNKRILAMAKERLLSVFL
jgi:UDP-galactopyranose mutase